jgi:hypothetical protein
MTSFSAKKKVLTTARNVMRNNAEYLQLPTISETYYAIADDRV